MLFAEGAGFHHEEACSLLDENGNFIFLHEAVNYWQ